MKIVSACLLGIKCRYDSESKPNDKIIKLAKKEKLVPVCPEQFGGLPTPREPAETRDDGSKVLDKKAKVITRSGKNVSESFIKGAEEVLKLTKLLNIKEAILKQKSPSCGCGKIYDGTFSDKLIEGDGVTTALLKRNGIKIITEEEFK